MRGEISKKANPKKGHQKKPGKRGMERYYLPAGVIMILLTGIIIYSNSFNNSFHFDDTQNIVSNPTIRDLADVKAWWNFYPMRPVSIFTFALNYHFNELDVKYWHLVNLLIHLINACLVMWLTRLIFISPSMREHPLNRHRATIAFFAALLFVSHPLATQSVTYIVQRMASLAAMFYLISVILYIKGRLSGRNESSKYLFFGGAVLSAALAFFTKENTFTLPLAIVLIEVCFLNTKKIGDLLRDYRVYIPAGLLVVFFVMTLFLFGGSIFKPIPPSLGNNTVTITWWNYLLTQLAVIVKYIQLLFIPAGLNLDYDFRVAQSFFDLRTILSLLLLTGILIVALLLYKKQRVLSFGILWFFITLSVESSFIPINDVIFEHRAYLPSVGFFILVTSGLFILTRNKYRTVVIVILILAAGLFSILSYQRNKVWKDDLTLWNDVVLKSPEKARPYGNRGTAYANLGNFNNALADYTRATQLNPEYAAAWYGRGMVYSQLKKFEPAIEDYSRAIHIDPRYAVAFNGRGIVYRNLGKWELALADYSKAVELDSTLISAHMNMGMVLSSQGKWNKAEASFSKVIEIDAENTDAWCNRGIACSNLRQWEKAVSDYSRAIEINPDYIEAYINRGITYSEMKLWDKAIGDFTEVIRKEPGDPTVWARRGDAFAELGRWAEALQDYDYALQIAPGFVDIRAKREIAISKVSITG